MKSSEKFIILLIILSLTLFVTSLLMFVSHLYTLISIMSDSLSNLNNVVEMLLKK